MFVFTSQFEKVALTVDDVEDHIGMYLDKKYLPEVDKGIAEQKAKRFALRHPIATGIPTLGLWPLASRIKASEELGNRLLRHHRELRDAKEEHEKIEHEREVALMQKHIAEREAEAREHMMTTGTIGALSALDSWHDHKKGVK